MILLGSGGHTGEMIRLLESVDMSKFFHRTWIATSGDSTSFSKAQLYEQSLKSLDESYTFNEIPRARKIITNGPGSSVMLCYTAVVLRLFHIVPSHIIYIESLARVNQLSLSGKLLLPITDQFIVQWPQLHKKYPKSKYLGILV